jgi:hypothetical protein
LTVTGLNDETLYVYCFFSEYQIDYLKSLVCVTFGVIAMPGEVSDQPLPSPVGDKVVQQVRKRFLLNVYNSSINDHALLFSAQTAEANVYFGCRVIVSTNLRRKKCDECNKSRQFAKKKVQKLCPLIQQQSRFFSAVSEREHLPLLKIF